MCSKARRGKDNKDLAADLVGASSGPCPTAPRFWRCLRRSSPDALQCQMSDACVMTDALNCAQNENALAAPHGRDSVSSCSEPHRAGQPREIPTLAHVQRTNSIHVALARWPIYH